MRLRATLVVAVIFAVSSGGGAATVTSAGTGFVRRVGTQLTLRGQLYRFVGLNFFQANMTRPIPNCSETAPNDGIDRQLTLMGTRANVIRAWFFQSMATRHGVRYWFPFDRTLAAATRHGFKVVATLADQWNYCEGPYKGERWYIGGYKGTVLRGDTVPYRRWVTEVVNRYKNNPAIALWELANEPEIHTQQDEIACPHDAAAVMRRWARDVSSLIKSIDPHHLVSLGSGGSGSCGLDEAEYAAVFSLPTLDVCTYHDYWGARLALASDPSNGIQRRINECRALNKPIYAGEVGITVGDVSSLEERASLFAAKAAAQFGAGVSGFLAWNWSSSSDGDYEIGPGDPSLAVLKLP